MITIIDHDTDNESDSDTIWHYIVLSIKYDDTWYMTIYDNVC